MTSGRGVSRRGSWCVLVLALFMAACGRASSGAQDTGAVQLSSSPSRTAAPHDSGAPSRTESGVVRPQAAVVPGAPCRSRDLSVRGVGREAGAGNRALRFGIVNEGKIACSLQGFPRLALLDQQGSVMAGVRVVRREATYFTPARPPARVLLAPRDTAIFDVTFTVVPGEADGCPTGSRIRISPPGDSAVIGTIQETVRACGARVSVTPVAKAEK